MIKLEEILTNCKEILEENKEILLEEYPEEYPEIIEHIYRKIMRDYTALAEKLGEITRVWKEEKTCECCDNLFYDDRRYEEEVKYIEQQKLKMCNRKWVEDAIKYEKKEIEGEKYYQRKEIKRIEKIRKELEEIGNYNQEPVKNRRNKDERISNR